MIRLHDTMSREKREFVPQDPKRITMYVCGPTVYGRAHIGNARPAVVFDLLRRVLKHHYPNSQVIYARNVTDVDDKIIAAAEEAGVGYRRITEKYYQHYIEDMGALGVGLPDFEPRATAFIDRMIGMIGRLISLGHAYEAEGHVLFSVRSDSDYGALSRRDRDAMIAGARVEIAPFKRDPADFVLWKPAGTSAEQVALSFESPWGRGRPGWHIECSAMIEAFADSRSLTETIDIHGGGLDLIFPHHENEITQSRCAHGGAPLANYWVHNGFVDMGAEKMSKSLGNVITPNELLAQGHNGETLRLALLSAHYRQPLPWTSELLNESKKRVDKLYRLTRDAPPGNVDPSVLDALADDLNTPLALSRLTQIQDRSTLRASANLLGLVTKSYQEHFQRSLLAEPAKFKVHGAEVHATVGATSSVTPKLIRGEPYIRAKIAERAEAKKNRDFSTADRIRDQLKEEGVQLLDRADGETDWERI